MPRKESTARKSEMEPSVIAEVRVSRPQHDPVADKAAHEEAVLRAAAARMLEEEERRDVLGEIAAQMEAAEHEAVVDQRPSDHEALESAEETEARDHMAQHQAIAAIAINNSLRVHHAIEGGSLDNIEDEQLSARVWEVLRDLRQQEFALEAALEEAWKSPASIAHSDEGIATRKQLVDAILQINGALAAIKEKADQTSRTPTEQAEYQQALEQAADAHEEDHALVDDAELILEDETADAEKRAEMKTKVVSQVTEVDHELETIDVSWDHIGMEEVAAHEEASKASAELHFTIYQLNQAEREAEPAGVGTEERVEKILERSTPELPLWEGVAETVHGIRAMIAKQEVDDSLKERFLADLAERYDALTERVNALRLSPKITEKIRLEMELLSAALYLLEDARHDLHTEGGEATMSVDTEEEKNLELKKELKRITAKQKTLAKEIRKAYGKPVEEVATLGRGIGASFKAALRKLALHEEDPLATWKELERKRQALEEQIGANISPSKRALEKNAAYLELHELAYPEEHESALTGRPIEGETEAKINARRSLDDEEALKYEAERRENRLGSEDRRAHLGLSMPKTEEDFFYGPLDEYEPVELTYEEDTEASKVTAILEAAHAHGLKHAEMLYLQIVANPLSEGLSFDPEEYIQQLVIVELAKSKQGAAGGLSRFFLKRRLASTERRLDELKAELRGINIDPETGGELEELPELKDTPKKKTSTKQKPKKST